MSTHMSASELIQSLTLLEDLKNLQIGVEDGVDMVVLTHMVDTVVFMVDTVLVLVLVLTQLLKLILEPLELL